MKYISTRGCTDPADFHKVVMMGLATDGGLLLPEHVPSVTSKLGDWCSMSYMDLAAAVMGEFVGDSLPPGVLADLVDRSYSSFATPEIVPVRDLTPVYFAELFQGPTLAFKDMALQFLGNLFEYFLRESGSHLNIIGATSGDTGSAAIYGVRGKQNIDIFIMHPDGRVSPIQRQQMTSVLEHNVHNIAIKGNFDDSQYILKQLFNDLPFKTHYNLGAVNSVNWARIMAQIVYYFYAAFRVRERTGCEAVQFCVPTGNFGNIFAGYMACRMGAPIQRLILATNENDILTRFFQTGVYERSTVNSTMSPSMDIQVASNFERYLYYRLGEDSARVQRLMDQFARGEAIRLQEPDPLFTAECGTTEQMLQAIRKKYEDHGYVLDPHSAVGVAVAERNLSANYPTICLGTAHPAKFPDAVRQATGKDIAHHPRIDAIMDLPTRCTSLDAEKEAVKAFIKATLEG